MRTERRIGWLRATSTVCGRAIHALARSLVRALVHTLRPRKRNALPDSIVQSSTDCIICMDASGRIHSVNPAAARLFGCNDRALLEAPIEQFIPGLRGPQPGAMSDALERLASSVCECEAVSAAGVPFPVEISISRVRLDAKRLYAAIVRDIRDRRAQQRELEYQATHDPLTALPNRAALAAHLEHARAWGQSGRPLALFMLDLCRFKEVNDSLGHSAGDRVLCEVARRFRAALGERGLVARIGGDEFTVVLSDLHDVTVIAETSRRLHESLSTPIDISGIAIDIGLSIGVALYPLDALDANTLLTHADVAMYTAKRRGSAYECYDAAHDQHSSRRLAMVTELRSAIQSGGINLHYQPKINLRSGVVAGVEALLRWPHPKFGGVSPAELVAAAEATDLILPLTEWTLREALAQLVRWRQSGLEVGIAVNLSARALQDTAFPARLRSLFEMSEAYPEWLEVEITESAMMVDPARALRIATQIHELGVRISVDDYGTGFSSLGYLRDLPIYALKLDRSFVLNMRTREGDRVIVESTMQMARALKLQVVAEGVETEWDTRFLRAVGCDYAQGYWYSRALPAPECLAWTKRFNATAEARHAALQPDELSRTTYRGP